jgi:hypothetical protein
MAYKYLYIDDNSEITAKGIITGLEKADQLKIDFDNPKGNWEDERQRILSEEFKSYDGLILDLNLEEMPNKKQALSFYKGSTLAQEIRNISKAGNIKEIPIVLLSATFNLTKYFDKTNEDLFDLIISRDDLSDVFISTREKLIALAEGYKLIAKCQKNSDYAELFRHDLETEDIRFLGEIKTIFEYPIHTVSNFLIKNIFLKTGILIPERILATRLGIDIEQSADWEVALKYIEKFRYTGVFAAGWRRWWMSDIEKWWTYEIDKEKSLRAAKASGKVQLLKLALGLEGLVPLQKMEKAKSESFWTNCVGSGAAIDTVDGLLVANQDNNFPWQDKNYISFDEALKPKGKNLWKKISASEEFRLEQLKKQFPNERPLQ